MDEDAAWKVTSAGAGLAAATATRPLIERGWSTLRGAPPPANPAHRDTSWSEALLWALVSGALVGVVRLVGQRGAAGAWHWLRGQYPRKIRAGEPA